MKTRMLAIDTSTDYLTLAVTDGNRVIGRLHKKAPRSHSSLLMPMIDTLLKKSRLKLKDIDTFCIGVGPGSFTGLRIGVATIKALAYVIGKPIIAVPTFDAIAYNAVSRAGVICVVLDARKSKVYGCLYRSNGRDVIKRISGYLLVPVEELLKRCERYDNIYILGDYAEKIVPFLAGSKLACVYWHPRAENIASIGAGYLKEKRFVSPEKLEPMYIYSRECDITGV